jgi:peptidoglycan-associated lipoprotein
LKILRFLSIAFVLAVFISFGSYGCAKKQVVTEGGKVESVRPSEAPDASKGAPKEAPGEEKPSEVMRETKEAPPGPTEQPEPVEAGRAEKALKDVYFAFDSYELSSEAMKALQDNADWIKANKGPVITIEGHCDERGTVEYNLALGERRAEVARNYIVSLGVKENRLKTISYGKSKPADLGHTEEAWAMNRRAHFVVQ